jgi:hypothetical protein
VQEFLVAREGKAMGKNYEEEEASCDNNAQTLSSFLPFFLWGFNNFECG